MKQCPQCNTIYNDDTLRFCLQDGTPLAAADANDQRTVILPEMQTVVTAREQARNTEWTQTGPPMTPESKPRTGLTIVLTSLVTLILVSVVGAGVWIFMRERQEKSADVSGSSPVSSNNANTAKVARTPTPTANNANVNTSSTPFPNEAETKKEVAKAIATWRAQIEGGDLDEIVNSYADSVDYYLKKGANRDFIRNDRSKAYEKYDVIKLEISDVRVTLGPTETDATAEFDKEWEFEGETRSKGKVRQQLKMKRVNGEWLITSEQDMK